MAKSLLFLAFFCFLAINLTSSRFIDHYPPQPSIKVVIYNEDRLLEEKGISTLGCAIRHYDPKVTGGGYWVNFFRDDLTDAFAVYDAPNANAPPTFKSLNLLPDAVFTNVSSSFPYFEVKLTFSGLTRETHRYTCRLVNYGPYSDESTYSEELTISSTIRHQSLPPSP